MKTKLLLLIVYIGILFSVTGLSAQSYQTGAGIRFGGLTNGLTVKQFISKGSALEGMVSVAHKNIILTGLFEIHKPVDQSSLFSVYYGLGGHVGFFRDGGSYYYHDSRLYTSTTVAGIDGIVGLEYKFRTAPVIVSMDFKPFIDLFNGSILYFDGGIGLRYAF
jgi:hypothetical protein